jgi:hypothetical protein
VDGDGDEVEGVVLVGARASLRRRGRGRRVVGVLCVDGVFEHLGSGVLSASAACAGGSVTSFIFCCYLSGGWTLCFYLDLSSSLLLPVHVPIMPVHLYIQLFTLKCVYFLLSSLSWTRF